MRETRPKFERLIVILLCVRLVFIEGFVERLSGRHDYSRWIHCHLHQRSLSYHKSPRCEKLAIDHGPSSFPHRYSARTVTVAVKSRLSATAGSKDSPLPLAPEIPPQIDSNGVIFHSSIKTNADTKANSPSPSTNPTRSPSTSARRSRSKRNHHNKQRGSGGKPLRGSNRPPSRVLSQLLQDNQTNIEPIDLSATSHATEGSNTLLSLKVNKSSGSPEKYRNIMQRIFPVLKEVSSSLNKSTTEAIESAEKTWSPIHNSTFSYNPATNRYKGTFGSSFSMDSLKSSNNSINSGTSSSNVWNSVLTGLNAPKISGNNNNNNNNNKVSDRAKLDRFESKLDYNYLAENSLEAIEILPFVRREKGEWYLIKWWKAAIKWGLLTGPLLEFYKEQVNNSSVAFKGDFINDPNKGVGKQSFASKSSRVSFEAVKDQTVKPSVEDMMFVPLQLIKSICQENRARVICIGDVHGCIDELCDLLRKVEYQPGDLVLFLGDLVAKGPNSVAVIQLAMDIGALSVRGNHDFEVCRHAVLFGKKSIGSIQRSGLINNGGTPSKAFSVEHLRIAQALEPAELEWIANLPYFIRSPDLGYAFVHAGFNPNKSFSHQEPWVMMTVRSIIHEGKITPRCYLNHPWGSEWKGPLSVLYGHDAARGFQRYPHALCADTGCVYGGNLTAILLPEETIVSVPARKAYLISQK